MAFRVLVILALPLLLIAAYWALLYAFQRSLLFPAPRASGDFPPAIAERIALPTEDGPGVALFLRSTVATGRAPLLIFTHGNAETAADWVDAFDEPRAMGVHVLLPEYPGYGIAKGAPSEASIAKVMDAAYAWATAQPAVDGERIIAYGRSLGGAVAVRLATDHRVSALILESTFTSTRAFARQFLAPSFLIRDPFDALSRLRTYRGPLLVIHGSHDTIVPIAHGRQLASVVNGAEFLELRCGHNDCPRQWIAVRQFLDSHSKGNTKNTK